MIPWMREKFAEKRAKWLARSKRNTANTTPSTGTASPTSVGSTSGSQETITTRFLNSARTFALNGARTAETHTQTEESCVPYCNHTPTQTQPSCILSAVAATPPPLPHCESTATNTEPETMTAGSKESSPTPSTLCRRTTKKGHTRLNAAADSDGTDTATQEPTESIIVRVICPSARILVFRTDVTKRLADLKAEVILELCDDPDSIQLFAADVRHLNPRYRLYRANYEGGELNESQTIAQLHIRDNESLMLSARRSMLQQHLTHTREVPGPSEQVVEMATRYLPSNESSLPLIDINEIFQQSNIQYDVRKVLISLAQVSATIIGSGPYAARLIAMLKQRLINKRNHLIDTLQCLVDMGFKREIAEYALKANNNVYSTTLEWLIQNQSEDSEVEQHAAIGLQRSQSSISPSTIVANNESVENTCALLEIVRIYSHRDVPPGEEIVESLTEMGFEEADVVMALKKTGNNKAAACEWLCGNRSGSVTELRDGLAADSPILKVILEMPQVQMNLANPKTFLAFLSILENEHAIRVWRGDSDTTSIITHILQKYHEEKHVLGINQFYGNR